MKPEPWAIAWTDQVMSEVTKGAHKEAIQMLKEQGLEIEKDSAADDLIGVGIGYGAAKVIEILLKKGLIKDVDKPV